MTTFNKINLLIILLVCSVGCTSLLYYPNSYLYIDTKKLDHPPTEIELSADGEKDLLSWYFESKKESRKPVTIVLAHGNGQNMSAHFRSLYWILEYGFNYLIVGYPGYGPNAGNASPSSTVETLASAILWVKENRPQDSILIYGQSLGGNVALRTVSENNQLPYCAVVIEGSFLSYQKAAQETLARNWLLWSFQYLPYLVISNSKSADNNLSKLPKTQYLVIHGKEDQTVAFKLGLELFDKLPKPKQIWAIEKGHHIDTFFRHPEKRSEFLDFIRVNCLAATREGEPQEALHEK